MKTLIEQIDENTYSINGRTFKHTGEDVRSPMEQNVQDAIDFHERFNAHIATFCQGLKALEKNKLDNTQQQDEVLYPWQKDFEVLQCKNHLDAIIDKNDDGTFGESKATISQIIENSFTHIHSIRRISDNAVFTVGDKVVINDRTIANISEIQLLKDMLFLKEGETLTSALNCQPYTEPKLPTLVEVFKSVQPKWYLDSYNEVTVNAAGSNRGDSRFQNQLSTKQQCEQLQAYIALRVIADWANGEAGWMPKKGEEFFTLERESYSDKDEITVWKYTMRDKPNRDSLLQVYFKQREHAEQAISILKEAGLLDALKG